MIPLRDHNKTERFPIITYLILGVNILVFMFMLTMNEAALESFLYTFALIPHEIVSGKDMFTLITSMFLHGGFGHLLGNMLFLHVFGDNLEDKLGHVKYLLFYLVSGLGASLLQIMTDPGSTIPNLGASGAIAGLLGGYLLLFPRHQVDILLPIGGFLRTATVPAYTMLVYWIMFQFLQGVGSLGLPGSGGVAYFAHIGGFVSGALIIFVLKVLSGGRDPDNW